MLLLPACCLTSLRNAVSSKQAARYDGKDAENAQFKIFDIAPYGVPYAIWGFLFVLLTQRWLLPGNVSRFCKDLRLALRVGPRSHVHGRTLVDAGLRSLHGATVVGILRKGVWFR